MVHLTGTPTSYNNPLYPPLKSQQSSRSHVPLSQSVPLLPSIMFRNLGAGILLGHAHVQVQQYHKHAVLERCCSPLQHQVVVPVLVWMYPLQSIYVDARGRSKCLFRGPHRKGKFPSHHSLYSLFEEVQRIQGELCDEFRESIYIYMRKPGDAIDTKINTYADFAKSYISAYSSKILHTVKSKLT